MSGIRVSFLPKGTTMKHIKKYFSKPENRGWEIQHIYFPLFNDDAVVIFKDKHVAGVVSSNKDARGLLRDAQIKTIPVTQVYKYLTAELESPIADFLEATPHVLDELQYYLNLIYKRDAQRNVSTLHGNWYQLECAWKHIEDFTLQCGEDINTTRRVNSPSRREESPGRGGSPIGKGDSTKRGDSSMRRGDSSRRRRDSSKEKEYFPEAKPPTWVTFSRTKSPEAATQRRSTIGSDEKSDNNDRDLSDGGFTKRKEEENTEGRDIQVRGGKVTTRIIHRSSEDDNKEDDSEPPCSGDNDEPVADRDIGYSEATPYHGGGELSAKGDIDTPCRGGGELSAKDDIDNPCCGGGGLSAKDDIDNPCCGGCGLSSKDDTDTPSARGFELAANRGRVSPGATKAGQMTEKLNERQEDPENLDFRHGPIHVSIFTGNVTLDETVVFVNASRSTLKPYRGFAAAFESVTEHLEECSHYWNYLGKLKTSDKVTYVIHDVGPLKWKVLKDRSIHVLTRTFLNVITYASMYLKMKSINIPLISPGDRGKLEVQTCVKAFLDAVLIFVSEHCSGEVHLSDINLINNNGDNTVKTILCVRQCLDMGLDQLTETAVQQFKEMSLKVKSLKCRTGNKGKFMHEGYNETAQRQMFWGGGDKGGQNQRISFRDSFQPNQNPYKWQASDNQQQQQHQARGFPAQSGQLSPAEIVKSLAAEVELVWENGNIWPFSCLGFENESPCLPGFTDMSYEELRYEAYEARKQGAFEIYMQKVATLYREVEERRQELKNPNMTLKEKLTSIVEDSRRKQPSRKTLAEEVEIVWEGDKLWTFTCLGSEIEVVPSLPGLTDMSYEELRCEAYAARKQGAFEIYIQKMVSLYQEAEQRRRELENRNIMLKEKLSRLP